MNKVVSDSAVPYAARFARGERRDNFMDEGLIAQSVEQYNSNGRFLWTRPAYGGSMNKVMSDSAVLYAAR